MMLTLSCMCTRILWHDAVLVPNSELETVDRHGESGARVSVTGQEKLLCLNWMTMVML